MTDNGIFTVSDLAGTDPHSFWITGLPHAEQPHVWESPHDPLANNARLLWEQALIDNSTNQSLISAGLDPYTLQPRYPQAPAPIGARQYNLNGLRSSWEFKHPVRAFLVGLRLRHAPTDQELIQDWGF